MSDTLSFEMVNAQIDECYWSGDYVGALELATSHLNDFPDYRGLMIYWQLCMSARVEGSKGAVRVLKDALDEDFWFTEAILRESPSLAPLVGIPEYEQLIVRSAAMVAEDNEQPPESIVVEPKAHMESYPLLLGLHGNSMPALAARLAWEGLSEEGYLLAFPQSKQMGFWKADYVWNDRDVAVQEVSDYFETICEQYPIDRDRVVISGHSMGGQPAIWLALSGIIKAKGFITIGPYLPEEEIDAWDETIEAGKGSNIRGVIFLGEQDKSVPHEGIHKLAQRLNTEGKLCKIEIVPNEGHEITSEFRRRFPEALHFVAGG